MANFVRGNSEQGRRGGRNQGSGGRDNGREGRSGRHYSDFGGDSGGRGQRGRGNRDHGSGRQFGQSGGDAGGRGGHHGGRGNRDHGGGGQFGQRGGGSGRGSGKKSMSDIPEIKNLLKDPNMSNQSTISSLQSAMPSLDQEYALANPRYPPNIPSRSGKIPGILLSTNRFSLKANHFRIRGDLPGRIFQYHVHIRLYDRQGILREDVSHNEDPILNIFLLVLLKSNHPDWTKGFTYDSRCTVFTTDQLPLPDVNADGQPYLAEDITIPNDDGTASRRRYKITITSTTSCVSNGDLRLSQDPAFIRALDISVLETIRQGLYHENPLWYLNGNIAFNSSDHHFEVDPRIFALQGYFVGFKNCLAGLTLVCDMCTTVFLNGGPIINAIAEICGFPSVEAWVASIRKSAKLDNNDILKINKILKNTKLKTIHLGHSKKFKGLGPASNDPQSIFQLEDGRRVTVAKYFQEMSRSSPEYRRHLPNNCLRYPELPTINVGSVSKPIFIPMELVYLRNGQNMTQKCTPDMTSRLIRHAAVPPDERIQSIKSSMRSGLLNTIRTDPVSAAFGVSNFDVDLMSVSGRLLPPPKLYYGNNSVVEPLLNGSWNAPSSTKLVSEPPSPSADGSYTYGVVLFGQTRRGWQETVQSFLDSFQNTARSFTLRFRNGGSILHSSNDSELSNNLKKMMGVRFVLIILCDDEYENVKYTADKMGVITCCLRWKTVENPNRGQLPNILVKLNAKLGGISHTISLMNNSIIPFNKLCMVVGIDVSHAAPGSDLPSVAAVVGSLDRQATQYATHLSAQGPRVEIVSALTEAMVHLLTAFRQRNNGRMPDHIVVYRDGVGDGQFDEVLNKELPCIQNALAELGQLTTKVSMIICQKRHKTRFVYEDSPNHYINTCPGVCVDCTGGENSIASTEHIEFFLSSHVAIQGTAKACKYTLLYDEIGLTLGQLEIMTYWLCYLYSRCNRSVSLATPAYYAHWASKRARTLLSGGADDSELRSISRTWSLPSRHSTMFFI